MRRTTIATVLFAGVIVFGGWSLAPGQAQKDKDKDKDKPAATAVFELYKDRSEEFRFRLVIGDTKLAMAPHGYKTKDDAMKAIATIQKEAAKAKVDDQTKK
jgi:uncharacterized protein YegP (UPF0339 family)